MWLMGRERKRKRKKEKEKERENINPGARVLVDERKPNVNGACVLTNSQWQIELSVTSVVSSDERPDGTALHSRAEFLSTSIDQVVNSHKQPQERAGRCHVLPRSRPLVGGAEPVRRLCI